MAAEAAARLQRKEVEAAKLKAEEEARASRLKEEEEAKAARLQQLEMEAQEKRAEADVKANKEAKAQAVKDTHDAATLEAAAQPESHELPSASAQRRAVVTKKFSHLMDNLQSKLFVASQHINDLTGYSSIDAMKRQIIHDEAELVTAKEEVRVSRLNYKQLVADRAASQREVTTLLARKDSWTPIDLERFTQLYRSDHTNEHAVQQASQHLADVERAAEQAASKLNSSILARYHEEQIWSDKIRRMSTWGTWGLMGVNVLLFLVFQFGFEPWRRERLTRGFEDKVKMALAHERERELERLAAQNLSDVGDAAETAPVAPVAAAAAVAAAGSEMAEAGLKEDAVAEVAPELIAAIEEYAEGQVHEDEANAEAIRHEAEVESADPAEMSAALDAETELLVSAEPADDPSAPAPIPFMWSAPETWATGVQTYVLNPTIKFARFFRSHFKLLWSDRKVELRFVDVTTIALEGVATGAAIATVVCLYFVKPTL